MDPFEFSLITAANPARLSKAFCLTEDGTLEKSPGGQLVEGRVERLALHSAQALAETLVATTPAQAFVYGVPEHDAARVVTQEEMERVKGNGGPPVIARTRQYFKWPEGAGILIFDYDPPEGSAPLSAEGFRAGVYEICPALEKAPHVIAASASAFIYHGERMLRGPAGWRLFVIVENGKDIPRAGTAFFVRGWLTGNGYIALSKSGAFLERGLVDPSVWQPERLDFIGGAHCDPPLKQRRPDPQIFNPDAAPLDTLRAIPSLTLREQEEKHKLTEAAKKQAEPTARAIRDAWVESRVKEALEKHPEGDPELNRTIYTAIYKQAVKSGALLAGFVLYPEQGDPVTVGDLLDNPAKWHNKRFADPLEPDYANDGRIAVANLYATGKPYIYSHAHGGQRFTLQRARSTVTVQKGERVAIVEQALELMNAQGQHFRRGGEIVKASATGELYPRDSTEIAFDLDMLACWQRFNKRDKVFEAIDCPAHIATGLMAYQTNWTMPVLDSVATAPIMDPRTGRFIDRDGYDPGSRLLLLLNDLEEWPGVPEKPTRDDLDNALATLWEPFKRFPFVGPIDCGVMLTALLTAAIRPLLPTAPAFAFDAPTAGSGKSLLAKCLSFLAGESVPGIFPSASEEEEIRKRLLAALRMNKRVLVIDNVETELKSAALCGLLTSEVYSDRVLKETEILSVPSRILVLITGNNIALRGDLCRRVLTVRIDPEIEQPWTRRFALDPADYCRERRLELVAAALTILRGGLQNGADLPDRTASFETWSDSVRRAVVYAGGLNVIEMADPIESINTALSSDTDTLQLKTLLGAWFEEWGATSITVAELVRTALKKAEADDQDDALLSIIKEIAGTRTGINNQKLGKWLEKSRERIVNGLKLLASGKGHRGARTWCVKKRNG
jgi:hypothetical protein